MSLWAIATLGYQPSKSLLQAAEKRLMERLPLLCPQDISMTLWAFGRLHYKPTELLDEVPLHIGRRLHEFKPQELSCVLFCYAHSRHYHASLLDAAAQVIIGRAPQMSHQDVVIAMWTYGIFGHRPSLSGPWAAAALRDQLGECVEGGVGSRGSFSSHRSLMQEEEGAASSSGLLAASDHHQGDSGGHSHEMEDGGGLRSRSSRGASSSSSSSSLPQQQQVPGMMLFVEALVSVARRRLRYLRPRGIANVIKALGNLRVAALPNVQVSSSTQV